MKNEKMLKEILLSVKELETKLNVLLDEEEDSIFRKDAYAILYEDGDLIFQRGNVPDETKGKVLGIFAGFDKNEGYVKKSKIGNAYSTAPWLKTDYADKIKRVIVKNKISPKSTAGWFGETSEGITRGYGHLSNCVSMDLGKLDTSKVSNMSYMFCQCSSLTALDVSNFDTSKVMDMNSIFFNCSALTTLDVSSFDTSKVMDMNSMFFNCSALTTLDISSFDTSKVINMSGIFYNCSTLTTVDVSGFDTSKVTDMNYMFCRCSTLTILDVSSFDTSKVMNMNSMFAECTALTTLDVSSFDTSEVTDMSYMFCNCSALTTLDLSGFDTSSVTDNMNGIFIGCSTLKTVLVNPDHFDARKVAREYKQISFQRLVSAI